MDKALYKKLQLFAKENKNTFAAETEKANKDKKINKEPNKKELKYSDADVDKIIKKKFAKWEKRKESEITKQCTLAQIEAFKQIICEIDMLQKTLNELICQKQI